MWTASTLGRAIVLIALTAFSSSSIAAPPTGATIPDRANATTVGPHHELFVRSEDDMDLARWAIETYRRAGLQLPSFTIVFHDELEACQGYYGYFRATSPPRIDICGFNNDRFLPAPRRMTLHEMAHAWVSENIDDVTIRAFLELRGLSSWNESTVDWDERGFEHAAEVIAWTLLDEKHAFYSIPGLSPEDLSAAYELLTGNQGRQ